MHVFMHIILNKMSTIHVMTGECDSFVDDNYRSEPFTYKLVTK